MTDSGSISDGGSVKLVFEMQSDNMFTGTVSDSKGDSRFIGFIYDSMIPLCFYEESDFSTYNGSIGSDGTMTISSCHEANGSVTSYLFNLTMQK